MTRLLAITLLLAACDQPRTLVDDTDQPLPASTDGTHGYWAYRLWPTLVLDEAGSCPTEAVDAALAPFHAAGIDVAYEAGECRPDAFHVEDGRVCLRVDDDALMERWAAGNASWWTRPGHADEIVGGSITVMSSCNPMVIAHEAWHVLGLAHSENTADTMFPAESSVLSFDVALLATQVARREAYLAQRANER